MKPTSTSSLMNVKSDPKKKGERVLRGNIAQFFADLDLLARGDGEVEILRRLEDEYHGAPKAEATHLLSGKQWLAVQHGRGSRVDSLGVRPGRRAPAARVGAQLLIAKVNTSACLIRLKTYLVEVDLDAPDVGRTDRYHAEETVLPSSQKGHALIQHEQVLNTPRDERADAEQLAHKVPAALDHPRRGAVEPMVVAWREIDDAEEQAVPGLEFTRAVPRAGPLECGAHTELCGNGSVMRDCVREGSVGTNASVDRVAVSRGWCSRVLRIGFVRRGSVRIVARAEQLVERVWNAVNVGKFTVGHKSHVTLGECDALGLVRGSSGWCGWLVASEECIERVGNAFDLLNSEVLNCAEVKDGSVRWADLCKPVSPISTRKIILEQ